jgi:hypothetical protein
MVAAFYAVCAETGMLRAQLWPFHSCSNEVLTHVCLEEKQRTANPCVPGGKAKGFCCYVTHNDNMPDMPNTT